MSNRFLISYSVIAVCFATPVLSKDLQINWDAAELGLFEETNEVGEISQGLAVYVPSNRIATASDFRVIFPDFCESHLPELLKYTDQLGEVPEFTLVKLQLEYYGPKIGESKTYIGRAITVVLEDGRCAR